jgi:hypothetical protein
VVVGPIEDCWQVRSASGQVFRCLIFRDPAGGLEVSIAYVADGVRRTVVSERVTDANDARVRAARWRQLVFTVDDFKEWLH